MNRCRQHDRETHNPALGRHQTDEGGACAWGESLSFRDSICGRGGVHGSTTGTWGLGQDVGLGWIGGGWWTEDGGRRRVEGGWQMVMVMVGQWEKDNQGQGYWDSVDCMLSRFLVR